MDNKINNLEVVCCFCGETLFMNEAVLLTARPSLENDESQNLFCHRVHLTEKIHKS
jgi:hypothetical protein